MEKYTISKNILIGLLADQMKLRALEYQGVDNWIGYGENFDEMKLEFLPESIRKDYEDEYISWEEVANYRLNSGEFELSK